MHYRLRHTFLDLRPSSTFRPSHKPTCNSNPNNIPKPIINPNPNPNPNPIPNPNYKANPNHNASARPNPNSILKEKSSHIQELWVVP